MKTIKLYDEMPYSTDFKATVVEVNKNEIILDQTLFFPEEGGQECNVDPESRTLNKKALKND